MKEKQTFEKEQFVIEISNGNKIKSFKTVTLLLFHAYFQINEMFHHNELRFNNF